MSKTSQRSPRGQIMEPPSPGAKAEAARRIVKAHAIGAAATAAIPLPVVPGAALIGVQLRMMSKLAELHEVHFYEQRATAIIGALGSVGISSSASHLLGLLPGVGTAAALVGNLTFGPAATFALGQVFTRHLESGGTFLNFDPRRATPAGSGAGAAAPPPAEEPQSFVGIKP